MYMILHRAAIVRIRNRLTGVNTPESDHKTPNQQGVYNSLQTMPRFSLQTMPLISVQSMPLSGGSLS